MSCKYIIRLGKYLSVFQYCQTPAGDLDIYASSWRNISKAKNKERGGWGCNQYTTTKHEISEDTG